MLLGVGDERGVRDAEEESAVRVAEWRATMQYQYVCECSTSISSVSRERVQYEDMERMKHERIQTQVLVQLRHYTSPMSLIGPVRAQLLYAAYSARLRTPSCTEPSRGTS